MGLGTRVRVRVRVWAKVWAKVWVRVGCVRLWTRARVRVGVGVGVGSRIRVRARVRVRVSLGVCTQPPRRSTRDSSSHRSSIGPWLRFSYG